MANGIVSILDSEEEFQIVGCLAHRLPCTRKKEKKKNRSLIRRFDSLTWILLSDMRQRKIV